MSHKIAPNSLDFSQHWSVTVPGQKNGGNGMDRAVINEA
jgi:hypothetical protein